jgi:S-adenosylmethionine-dependent methyltransferase
MDDSAETVFDRKLDEFRQWQASPWGQLRYRIAAANLSAHLPAGRLEVLDVGGGNGLDAVALAELGHRVTIVDVSAPSLAAAEALADARGLGDRIRVLAAGFEDLDGAFGPGGFDVVLCHNVIQYLPTPRQAITMLPAQLNTDGRLSVIAPNAAEGHSKWADDRSQPTDARADSSEVEIPRFRKIRDRSLWMRSCRKLSTRPKGIT